MWTDGKQLPHSSIAEQLYGAQSMVEILMTMLKFCDEDDDMYKTTTSMQEAIFDASFGEPWRLVYIAFIYNVYNSI